MTDHHLRIGALHTGVGVLDLAVRTVLGGEVIWRADPDPDAAKVTAHHLRDTLQLGDPAQADWTTAPRVDLLACRLGGGDNTKTGNGTRTRAWRDAIDALAVLAPRYVFVEGPAVLRRGGVDQVLADLNALGYACRWTTLRARDVGAPQRCERLYLFGEHCHRDRAPARAGAGTPAGPGANRRHQVSPPDPTCLDGGLPAAGTRLPAGPVAPGSTRMEREQSALVAPVITALLRESVQAASPAVCAGDPPVDWGPFKARVRHWEQILGRPAPAPSTPGPAGTPLVTTRIGEFLTGLPDGYLAQVPDLTRRQAVRLALAGGCVHQAAAALHYLLHRPGSPRL
ncbi:DNA (cytosine-5)-methyltransferase 1 [Streptacidiphilus sp. MAP12-16]|uniref:DNA cytosine methyltransferase n=1 Tax=Streptacidiphilus sp. MAP12-16 TaxID=3156300 RepID=UPI003517D911